MPSTLVRSVVALLLAACIAPAPSPSGAPSISPAQSRQPAVVLAKLPLPAKLGEQGIRVAPNGELLLVVEREGFEHTIYDLSGKRLASLKVGEIGMNALWLPDSSGVVVGRRTDRTASGAYVLEVSILGADGSVRVIGQGVSSPRADTQLVSPDGASLAFDTPCCPSRVVVLPRSGGDPRTVAIAETQLRVLGWDADGHVIYWAGGDAVEGARADGSRYRVLLGLPDGVRAVDITPDVRTTDAVASVLSINADGAFPGSGPGHTGERTLVGRALRAFKSASTPLSVRLTAREVLTYAVGGALGAYDIATGTDRAVLQIANDDGVRPTTMSGTLLMASPGRTWIRVLDIARDDRWHETEVGMVLQTAGYALSRGRFLVFDEAGAPYLLDGAAARAAPARARPEAVAPNRVIGTVRSASAAVVDRTLRLEWRLADGAPRSLDYFGGRLIAITLWTRQCRPCLDQLGVLADAAEKARVRPEIFALGVDESEASALDAVKDHWRLRPLVGTSDVLKELAPSALPETIVLDSEHEVRYRFRGLTGWDALLRAFDGAARSRLALRDGR